MDVPSVSIIIPVYNAQKTIEHTLNSLQKQTLNDIEVLIIDDCSTDDTSRIISEIIKTDTRIKYFCLEKNSGPGIARNLGLKEAKGKYIGFMDADDIVEENMFEQLYINSDDADIVISGYADAVPAGGQKPSILSYAKPEKDVLLIDRQEILKSLIYLDKNRLFAFLWNKLYKKEILDNKLFSEKRLNEDYCFNCLVWQDLSSLKMINKSLYYYIDHSNGSLSRKFIPDYFEIMYNKFVITKNLFVAENMFFDDIRGNICTMHIKHLIAGISKLFFRESGLSAKQIRKKIKEIMQHETCIEACKYARATRKQERICNFILSCNNVSIVYIFSKLLFILKYKMKGLFGKIK